jgi:FlaA1/EpsC-like NDP-sugar epimerase
MSDSLTNEQVQELLGRTLDLSVEDVRPLIEDQCVLVTGAGGSIGSALVLQLIALKPRTLVLYESSEFALYKIEQAVKKVVSATKIVPILGNLSSSWEMERLLKTYKVDRVYHAAAYKHVPMVERNPIAGIRNNVFGTRNLALAAHRAGVKDLVLVSTDKAVKPTNVMGATKKLAELCVLCLDAPFRVVRFGNVLCSNGSVIPLFMEQIANGECMTVTHPDVTRYFMSVEEAVSLILQSSLVSEGRICVLDMGDQVSIYEMAERLAKMLGHDKYPVKFIGLRPGEKMYEELTLGSQLQPTNRRYIQVAQEQVHTASWVDEALKVLEHLVEARDVGGIRSALGSMVPDYSPACGILDDLWLEENVFAFGSLLEDCFAPTARAQ